MSTPPLARISYANKDYESIRDALIARIPKITNAWSDYLTSDMGITLLELYVGIAELLCYYLDHQANEAYLETAIERKNIIRLTRLIGYKLESLSASSANLTFSIRAVHSKSISIPKYTRTKGTNNLEYLTIEDAVIPAGQTSVSVAAKQGTKSEEIFTPTGLADYSLTLNSTDIAEGTIEVFHGNESLSWTEEGTLINSESTDTDYIREIDENNYQTLIFGDNVNGKIPTQNLTIKYITTSGASGNIGAGLVNSVVSSIYDSEGDEVVVTVTNANAFTGGAGVESITEAKVQAPAELATQDRMVTKTDFESLLNGYPGVLKTQAVDVSDSIYTPFRYVALYVIPEGGGQISEVLEDELTTYVDDYVIEGTLFEFKDVTYVTTDITAVLYVYQAYNANQVKASVVTALEDLFSLNNLELGQDLSFSLIAATIQNVSGVAYVNLQTPDDNITVSDGQILTLGSTNITLGEKI